MSSQWDISARWDAQEVPLSINILMRGIFAGLLADNPTHQRMQIKVPKDFQPMYNEASAHFEEFIRTGSPKSFSQFFELAKAIQQSRGKSKPDEQDKATLVYERLRRKG